MDVDHIFESVSSKDILMRVIAQNLPAESTPVEKVFLPLSMKFCYFITGVFLWPQVCQHVRVINEDSRMT